MNKKQAKKKQPTPGASPVPTPTEILGGANPRKETAGCPTGLSNPGQAESAQRQGGGGAPGTGSHDPFVPVVHAKGVGEEQ